MLNQSYEPMSVCTVKRATILVLLDKAEMVEQKYGAVVRSQLTAVPCPSVIRVLRYIKSPYRKIELSRKNILRRDGQQCQYCGTKKLQLTIDHIMPRSRGGGSTWENLITACVKCNIRKGNRTPEEAHMPLLTTPRKPNHVAFLQHLSGEVEESWRQYLFM